MSEIYVVARAKAQPGTEQQMERALQTNAEASRQEGGCVSYVVLRGEGGLYMTVERWKSKADFDQHMASPHVQTLFGAITPLVAGAPEIVSLTEV